ncbi:MAG: hypothetical protein ACYC5V_10770 [Gemmatimonadaceae bacterium]
MFIQWDCQLSQGHCLLLVPRMFDQPKVGKCIEVRPPSCGNASGPDSPES